MYYFCNEIKNNVIAEEKMFTDNRKLITKDFLAKNGFYAQDNYYTFADLKDTESEADELCVINYIHKLQHAMKTIQYDDYLKCLN